MSYYDEEDYVASAKGFGFILKFAFNITVIILLHKFLYIPNFPTALKSTSALYVMPIIGIIGAYFYLSYWFGKKCSLYIIIVASFSIGLMAITSFETVSKLYGLGMLIGIGYCAILLIQLIIRTLFKKR